MKKKLLSVLLITLLKGILPGCSSEKDSVSDKTEKKVEEKLTKVIISRSHNPFHAPHLCQQLKRIILRMKELIWSL